MVVMLLVMVVMVVMMVLVVVVMVVMVLVMVFLIHNKNITDKAQRIKKKGNSEDNLKSCA